MWCGIKGIDCPYCGVFGECQRSACGSPNIETSTLGTSSSYLVNTISEEFITDIKREAVKEFAERLKEEFIKSANIQDSITAKKLFRDICPVKVDKVLKKFIKEK